MEAEGFPYSPGLIVTPRSVIHTSHMPFDTLDEQRVAAAFDLYPRGVLSPGKQGIWGTAARARWGPAAL